MQDTRLTETRQSLRPIRPEHQPRQLQDQHLRRRRKLRLLCRSEKLDREPRETRWQLLHLELRSGKLHNGKRVGTRGSPNQLRNGGEFGFMEGFPENRRGECRQGHPLTIHICAVQFVHKRGTHTQRAWLKNCIVIFVRHNKFCHLV